MNLATRISLGTYPFANVFTKVSEEEGRAIVGRFLAEGGFFIDTAPTYGLGQVETLLGGILGEFRREEFSVASKCGYVWDEVSPPRLSARYKDLVAECDKSLRRLRLDQLDLYILHEPDPETPPEETAAALRDLQTQGKIKAIGVSNVTLPQLEQYNASACVDYVQNRFSLLNQSLSDAFVEYCVSHGIGITPYQVIERGLLTDHSAAGLLLRAGDLRNTKPEFRREVVELVGAWVAKQVQPIARSQHISVAELAIWWSLQQPGVAFAICGATSAGQVTAGLRAATLDLEPGTLDRINASYHDLKERLVREKSAGVREFLGLV